MSRERDLKDLYDSRPQTSLNASTEKQPLLDTEPADTGLSMGKVGLNLCKCCVGAGSFSLPAAFKTCGLLTGFISSLCLGALAAYTFIILAHAEKHVSRLHHGKRFTFPEVARELFPNLTFGGINVLEVLVYFALCMVSLGACGAYVIFICTTMPAVIGGASANVVAAVVGPLALALAMLRSFKYLAFTSILGDFAVVSGVAATLAYGFQHEKATTDVTQFSLRGLAPAIGSLSFLYLSHLVCLPMSQSLRADLKEPRRFSKVVSVSYVIITCANTVFGALVYMLFREDTKGNVVANLSTGSILQVVRVLLSLDLLFTIPMLLAVSREVIENSILASSAPLIANNKEAWRNVIRTVLVIVLMGIGLGMIAADATNAFGNIVSIIGGLFGAFTGFVLPPLFHLRIHAGNMSPAVAAANGLIIVLGFALMVSSTYFTLDSMIN